MITDFQIESLFEGMANRITDDTVMDLTGKSKSEFKSITKMKFKRDLTLGSLQELGVILPHLQVLKLHKGLTKALGAWRKQAQLLAKSILALH